MASFEPPNVAFISSSDTDRESINLALSSSNHFRVHSVKTTALITPRGIERFHCVVLNIDDLGNAEVDFVDNIQNAFPNAALILISNKLEDDQVRQLFRAHVSDWLPRPVNLDTLISTVKTHAYASIPETNDVHAIVSAVGGAGATTTAVSLAGILAGGQARKGAKVALVDLDFSSGDCGYKLNTISDFDFASLAATPDRLDVELLQALEQQHDEGFAVFSFHSPDMYGAPGARELVLRMMDAVSTAYQITIVDIPYYQSSWTNDVLSGASSVTIVTEQSLPAVRHAVGRVQHIHETFERKPSLHILVNKWKGSIFTARVSKRRIRKLFDNVDIFFTPDVTQIVGEAADRGVLPTRVRRFNSYSRILAKFVKRNWMTR